MVQSGSTTLATYAYDALGRRVVETYTGTGVVNNLYDSALDQVIEERVGGTSASNLKFQYVWSEAYLDALVARDQYSGGVETQRLYAQHDANYDTTALVDTTGAVQERYLYDPYGVAAVTDANYNPRSQSAFGWQYLHQGGRLDPVTGWYNFRNRDLIPTEGRWAERDPLGFGGGSLDLYGNEGSSPTNFVDPSGLYTVKWKGKWTAAEKAAVNAQLAKFSTRIAENIAQIKAFQASLTPCHAKGITQELGDLLAILNKMAKKLASTTPLKLGHWTDPNGDNGLHDPGWVGPNTVWLNDSKGWPDAPWILFHELSHDSGAVDGYGQVPRLLGGGYLQSPDPWDPNDAAHLQALGNDLMFNDSQLRDDLLEEANRRCKACDYWWGGEPGR